MPYVDRFYRRNVAVSDLLLASTRHDPSGLRYLGLTISSYAALNGVAADWPATTKMVP